jgi:hypothetical protein
MADNTAIEWADTTSTSVVAGGCGRLCRTTPTIRCGSSNAFVDELDLLQVRRQIVIRSTSSSVISFFPRNVIDLQGSIFLGAKHCSFNHEGSIRQFRHTTSITKIPINRLGDGVGLYEECVGLNRKLAARLRRNDDAVDDCESDMDSLKPKAARHRLGEAAPARLWPRRRRRFWLRPGARPSRR